MDDKTKEQIIKELAKKSLKEKWLDQMKEVISSCAFCDDADIRSKTSKKARCSFCLIPKELCDNCGDGGLLGVILEDLNFQEEEWDERVKEPLIEEIDHSLYNLMIKSLKELSDSGKLTDKTKTEVLNIIEKHIIEKY